LRVAGGLALLSGLSITKIVRLRRDQVDLEDGTVSLLLDGHALAVPPKLGNLLAQLAKHATRATAAPSQLSGSSPLLYPGKTAHRPVLPTTLYAQLREHGIAILSARNTARLALAADLPAAALASLTGMEVTTADAWNKRVGHDWAPYLAAKDDVQNSPRVARSPASHRGARRTRATLPAAD
jgi:hypothetical protein